MPHAPCGLTCVWIETFRILSSGKTIATEVRKSLEVRQPAPGCLARMVVTQPTQGGHRFHVRRQNAINESCPCSRNYSRQRQFRDLREKKRNQEYQACRKHDDNADFGTPTCPST